MLDVCTARTAVELDYQKDGQKVVVPVGTCVLVDTATSVALIGGDHVDIDPSEYSIQSN